MVFGRSYPDSNLEATSSIVYGISANRLDFAMVYHLWVKTLVRLPTQRTSLVFTISAMGTSRNVIIY